MRSATLPPLKPRSDAEPSQDFYVSLTVLIAAPHLDERVVRNCRQILDNCETRARRNEPRYLQAMQCIAAPALTAIVLCGGRGVRMGGRDKPLMDFRGRPMVAHVCRALEHSVSSVLISANRNLATYAHYGIVVQDELADAGPLSGISSCLNSCATAYAFICPGDAPNLDQSMVQRLARSLATTDVGVVVDLPLEFDLPSVLALEDADLLPSSFGELVDRHLGGQELYSDRIDFVFRGRQVGFSCGEFHTCVFKSCFKS